MATTRTIWLFRHAKSSWADPGQRDFDRPLNGRGERDGPMMASWLETQTPAAQWIWSSDAKRAAATAEFVRQGFRLPAGAVHLAHELYGAGPEQMLDVLRASPPDVSAVALVAHNPGTTYLLNALTGQIVTDNVPTFGTARLAFTGDWHELAGGCCELELFTSPKRLT
jgi:phosphohistidine phosphatase